ncbi:MAG TPA: DUF1611 domain-containing protein [Pirellulaceae bacterium]|nr:DUF1611 domain-containing protein [Pirellulaceae bacterium]
MSRRIVILTEGHTNPHTAKTASCMIRYKREEVVALLDATQRGKTTDELLGVGGALPVIGALSEAPGANTLLLGIAPPGGKIPGPWRAVILEAIARGMTIWSGLHDFLSNDAEFTAAAAKHGVQLIDVRKNNEREIARRRGLRPDCLRIHTVGHDCSIGKMVTSVELTNGLKRRGVDAKFIATGQTGIMVEGDGLPLDCVVADFVAGAAEKMVLQHQHHDVLLVEGQGSLVHPSYSGVTLSLLHGCAPHGLIYVYEIGRTVVTGVEHVKIPSNAAMLKMYELMSNANSRCKILGIAINSRRVSAAEAEAERERTRREFGLPTCDVIRNGPDELVDAILNFKATSEWQAE